MKSMKGLSVNKMLGSLKKKASGGSTSEGALGTTPAATPETTAHNSVKAFCESGGNVKGDEVLFLPPIVDAAESSPAAAAECARMIRKYLSRDYMTKPSWQYNALMLMRILTDNPGETFTRNLDQKFVDATKQLLRTARDQSVRHILMEMLDDFEHSRMDDENLMLIVSMWKKEKEKALKDYTGRMPPPPPQQQQQATQQSQAMVSPGYNPHSQNYFARSHSNKRLPDPVELVSRLEEARTSAKLLEQVVMNTPPPEMLDNELIKEFADRCQSASRSIQGYMISENPAPDNDTMESLIDTNEQLQTALNQHQRAVLSARKHMGLGERSYTDSPTSVSEANANGLGLQRPSDWQHSQASSSGSADAALLGRAPSGNGKGKETELYDPPPGPPPGAGLSGAVPNRLLPEQSANDAVEDPFKDPQSGTGVSGYGGASSYDQGEQRLAYEPFHPGFNATDSYMGRQDSAVGKLTMHGAGAKAGASSANRHTPPQTVSDVSDDDDLYASTPKSKEPMYRY